MYKCVTGVNMTTLTRMPPALTASHRKVSGDCCCTQLIYIQPTIEPILKINARRMHDVTGVKMLKPKRNVTWCNIHNVTWCNIHNTFLHYRY